MAIYKVLVNGENGKNRWDVFVVIFLFEQRQMAAVGCLEEMRSRGYKPFWQPSFPRK